MINITKKLVTDIVEVLISDTRNELTWDEAVLAHEIVHFTLGQANKLNDEEPLYRVSARQTDRNYEIGLFTGRVHDIEAYCEDKQGYGLVVNEVKPKHIPSGYSNHKKNIVAKRDKLQAELDALNARLDSGDIS